MQPLTLGRKHNKTNILEATANQNVMILYHITPISSSTSHSQILCLAKEMTHLAKLHHCLLINPRNYLLLAASFSRLKRKKKRRKETLLKHLHQNPRARAELFTQLEPPELSPARYPWSSDQVDTKHVPPLERKKQAENATQHLTLNTSGTGFQLQLLSWITSCEILRAPALYQCWMLADCFRVDMVRPSALVQC